MRAYRPNEDQTWRDVYSREYGAAEGRGLQSWEAREEAARNGEPFGRRYGGDVPYITGDGRRVWMHRKGQRVRWLDEASEQVGPEQANVAPALAYAAAHGWVEESAGTPTCPECLYEHRTGNVAPVDHSCESDGEPYRRMGPEHEPNASAWEKAYRGTAGKKGKFEILSVSEIRPGTFEVWFNTVLDGQHRAVLFPGDFLQSGTYDHFRKLTGEETTEAVKIRKAVAAYKRKSGAATPNASGYYVWALARGSNAPLAEGPWGPYDTLESAKTFARIGATEGAHDRAVSLGLDPQAPSFQIVRRYEAETGERIL